jgi:hypothetical protein
MRIRVVFMERRPMKLDFCPKGWFHELVACSRHLRQAKKVPVLKIGGDFKEELGGKALNCGRHGNIRNAM